MTYLKHVGDADKHAINHKHVGYERTFGQTRFSPETPTEDVCTCLNVQTTSTPGANIDQSVFIYRHL